LAKGRQRNCGNATLPEASYQTPPEISFSRLAILFRTLRAIASKMNARIPVADRGFHSLHYQVVDRSLSNAASSNFSASR
jgi:hypothetical protein